MKILIISDYISAYGGVEKIILEKKLFLEKKNHKVKLFGSKLILRNRLGIINIGDFLRLKKVIKKYNPDLICIHNIRFNLSWFILLAIPKNKLSFIIFHDYSYICPRIWNINENKRFCNRNISYKCIYKNCQSNKIGSRYIIYNFLRYLKTILINYTIKKRIKYIFTPSNNLTKHIKLNFSSKYIKTLRNPINLNLNLINFNINNRRKYFLFVGRIEKEKGIIFLLEGFKKFLKNNKSEKLIIIGKGNLSNYINNFIKKNRLEKNIIYKGVIDNKNLDKYYRNAKCTLVPSLFSECFGTIVIESLRNKTPVLVSNIAGLNEQSKLFLNVYFFENYNLKEFIKKLDLFKSKYTKSFKEDFKIIEDQFSFESFHNQIINFYNQFKK